MILGGANDLATEYTIPAAKIIFGDSVCQGFGALAEARRGGVAWESERYFFAGRRAVD